MTETTATAPTATPTDPLFVRPREGRMLAGVCAGIAERWELDPTLVRIVTIALVLVSGVGAMAYVAAWLLTPSTDGPAPLHAGSPAARRVSATGERLVRRLPTLLILVVAAAVLVGVGHALWLGLPVGFLVTVAVLALVVGTRRGRWLAAAAAGLLVVALSVVAVFGNHFGTRSYDVASASELRPSYDYAAGTVRLDLSSLAGVTGRYRTDVRLGRGDVVVTVPSDLPVVVHARAGVGSVSVAGRKVSGLDAEQTQALGTDPASADRLQLDVTVGAGTVTVNRTAGVGGQPAGSS